MYSPYADPPTLRAALKRLSVWLVLAAGVAGACAVVRFQLIEPAPGT